MSDESSKATGAVQETENDKTARLAGAGAGVLAGAQVGTVLLPIPVVGTFTGALVGGLVGTKIGKKVGGMLLGKIDAAGRTSGTQDCGSDKADVTRELEKLAQLRASGVLSEDEFRVAKAKLLGL